MTAQAPRKRLPVLDDNAPDPFQVDTDLPVFQETTLDRDGLDCLLADLDDLTSIVEIRVKGDASETHSESGPDLLTARQLLLDGRAGALQIIYRFADRTWCDTLLADGQQTRLLRLEAPMRHV